MIAVAAQWVGVVFVVIGTVFTMISGYGIMMLGDTYQRQHAAAKPQMAGYLCFAIGIALIMQSWVWTGVLGLAILLQTMTAPLAAHLLAHATVRLERQERDRRDADAQ